MAAAATWHVAQFDHGTFIKDVVFVIRLDDGDVTHVEGQVARHWAYLI